MADKGAYAPLYGQAPASDAYRGEGAAPPAVAVAVAAPAPYGGYEPAPAHYVQQYAPQGAYQAPYGAPATAQVVAYPVAGQQGTAIPVAYAQPTFQPPGPPTAGAPIVGGRLMRTGLWSDGLCDCFNNCESCCIAWWFAPFRWAKTMERSQLQTLGRALAVYGIPWLLMIIFAWVGELSPYQECSYDYYYPYTYRCTYYYPWWPFAICSVCNILQVALGTIWRGRLREKYGIAGSGCEDCLLHTFCRLCAITQEARHVDRDTGFMVI